MNLCQLCYYCCCCYCKKPKGQPGKQQNKSSQGLKWKLKIIKTYPRLHISWITYLLTTHNLRTLFVHLMHLWDTLDLKLPPRIFLIGCNAVTYFPSFFLNDSLAEFIYSGLDLNYVKINTGKNNSSVIRMKCDVTVLVTGDLDLDFNKIFVQWYLALH